MASPRQPRSRRTAGQCRSNTHRGGVRSDKRSVLDPQHESVFQRLHEALSSGTGITLSSAEVELLWQIMGDQFGLAEQEYERWRERFEDYERARGIGS